MTKQVFKPDSDITNDHASVNRELVAVDNFILILRIDTLFNTFYFHQYIKDKLTSYQPPYMHNTRHITNSYFIIPLFNHWKTQKLHLYQVIHIWNRLQNSLKIAVPSLH